MKISVQNKIYTISNETLNKMPAASLREWDNNKYAEFVKSIEADNGIKGNRKGRATAGRAIVNAIIQGQASVGNSPFPAGSNKISEFWGFIERIDD